MTVAVDVRDPLGNLLGTVPMKRADWWRDGDRFRFYVQVEMPADLTSPVREAPRVELTAAVWSRGGRAGEWCLLALANEIPKLDRVVGFIPAATAAQPERKTMRQLTDHEVNPVNRELKIVVLDEPGHGGANHRYAIDWKAHVDGIGFRDQETGEWRDATLVRFQDGPIGEVGVNGVTHEALLAIVADRLRSFQAGPYSCKANACALTHIEEAMHWLQQRTIERMRRDVEGTHAV